MFFEGKKIFGDFQRVKSNTSNLRRALVFWSKKDMKKTRLKFEVMYYVSDQIKISFSKKSLILLNMSGILFDKIETLPS